MRIRNHSFNFLPDRFRIGQLELDVFREPVQGFDAGAAASRNNFAFRARGSLAGRESNNSRPGRRKNRCNGSKGRRTRGSGDMFERIHADAYIECFRTKRQRSNIRLDRQNILRSSSAAKFVERAVDTNRRHVRKPGKAGLVAAYFQNARMCQIIFFAKPAHNRKISQRPVGITPTVFVCIRAKRLAKPFNHGGVAPLFVRGREDVCPVCV